MVENQEEVVDENQIEVVDENQEEVVDENQDEEEGKFYFFLLVYRTCLRT